MALGLCLYSKHHFKENLWVRHLSLRLDVGRFVFEPVIPPLKKVSNPNVYFEFGFAVARIGFRRVIGVMNVAYGSPRDEVFDIKRRWALRYNLPEGADTAASHNAPPAETH